MCCEYSAFTDPAEEICHSVGVCCKFHTAELREKVKRQSEIRNQSKEFQSYNNKEAML